MNQLTRRSFMAGSACAAVGIASPLLASPISARSGRTRPSQDPLFKISLAQWSLHRTIRSGKLDNLDFAKVAKQEFGIDAVEYVNQFFKDKSKDRSYLREMKQRCEDQGVKSLLIMCDGVGQLGAANETARTRAVEGHFPWVEAAKFLGCHSIRVNAASSGSREEQVKRAADGLARLSEFAQPLEMNVIVENHGGLSSDGSWLAKVIETVSMDNCGTLPDFGNFNLGGGKTYDRYRGIDELMPFAKGVSAKSHEFDDSGFEIHTDYMRMLKIVLDHDYHGYIGIEYEGGKLDEYAGIRATQQLLLKVRDQLAKSN